MTRVRRVASLALGCALVTAGCSSPWATPPPSSYESEAPASPTPSARADSRPAPPPPWVSPRTSSPSSPIATPEAAPAPEPRRAYLTVPRLGLRDFPVVRYQGSPDDAPGTAIQNDGDLASPRGPGGGVAAGEVGHHKVTRHPLSSTEPVR